MAIFTVKIEDHSAEYLREIDNAVDTAVKDMGIDLRDVSQQAAPEKSGYLKKQITVKHSATAGAYQSDIESTAPYVGFIHDGFYKLGAKSAAKPIAVSKIGNYKKQVGRQYLQGAGEAGRAGYQEYLSKKISAVNSKYNS